MADILIKDDTVAYIPLVAFDAAGAIVPAPAGDTDAIVSGLPASLAMVVSTLPSPIGPYPAGFPAAQLTPMVVESDAANGGGGITMTITDTAGLAEEAAYTFSVVQDTAPTKVGLDTLNILTVPQALPTNPGP